MPKSPLAYLITFTTYGTWLHGDPRGSVIKDKRARPLANQPKLLQYQRDHLKEPPFILDAQSRNIILQSLLKVAEYRNWKLLAIHIRNSHIHIVIKAHLKPERIMNDFKSYATRALRSEGYSRTHFWTHHGNTQYLFSDTKIKEAIHYTLYEQGTPMTLYAQPIE
jgi:REP element-mobilizing transposase RayT